MREVKPVSSRVIDTNGAAIRITEGGASEPALVFLHYWGGSARMWQRVIDLLDRQVHWIAFDQRGWGDSVATDGRYDLAAMADDVESVVRSIGLRRYALVGHSMGGKVAQIVATRRPQGLLGLVLVAPAPPTPMPVPEAERATMLTSYGSRDGVLQAISVLAATPLTDDLRVQVIEDTLRDAPEAKRAWTDRGMIEDVSGGIDAVTIPVSILVGSRNQVEHESALREVFCGFLPQATVRVLEGIGHLSPLEAPGDLADACSKLLAGISPVIQG
jgi:3-oxoadipate enol-lactonase